MAKSKKKSPIQDKEQLSLIATEMWRKGTVPRFISSHLVEISQGAYPEAEIEEIVSGAVTTITDNYFTKIKEIKLLHVKRYTNEIHRLFNTKEIDQCLVDVHPSKGGVTQKQFETARRNKIKALDKCIDTAIQLENILEISHDKTTTVDYTHDITIKLTEMLPQGFNPKRLTFEEACEFVKLCEKARVGYEEPESVKEVIMDEINTEDVVAEVLPANVEQIVQVAPKAPELEGKPNLRDKLEAIKARLQQRANVEAAIKLEQHGANLDETEKEIASKN